MKTMRVFKYLVFTSIILMTLLAMSCKKDNDETSDLTVNVVGTYKGTLAEPSQQQSIEATAKVTKADFNIVHISCYGPGFDTTFLMELFENGDSMMVCNTGSDFKMQYGHNRMEEHHEMMGDSNWQDWGHHMDEEHDGGDEHFGGFDMDNRSFGYDFIISNDSTLQFNGLKQ